MDYTKLTQLSLAADKVPIEGLYDKFMGWTYDTLLCCNDVKCYIRFRGISMIWKNCPVGKVQYLLTRLVKTLTGAAGLSIILTPSHFTITISPKCLLNIEYFTQISCLKIAYSFVLNLFFNIFSRLSFQIFFPDIFPWIWPEGKMK